MPGSSATRSACAGLLLVEADGAEAEAAADDGRLAGLLDEHREDRVGDAG